MSSYLAELLASTVQYALHNHNTNILFTRWSMPECSGRCWCTKVVAERGGGSVLLSVKVTWRSREALEGSQQCRVQQCTVQGSQPHCRFASAPTRGSTVQPFVPHRLPLSTFTLVVLLHLHLVAVSVAICVCLLVSSLCGLEVEVPPLELCVRLNSAARLGSRSVQSPLESSTIMTHYNLHLRIGRRGTVWYCLVLSWIRAVLDGIGWYWVAPKFDILEGNVRQNSVLVKRCTP